MASFFVLNGFRSIKTQVFIKKLLTIRVNDEGGFYDIAIDANCKTYTHHPTTNYQFSKMGKIPDFKKYIEFVKDLHKNILHHNFVSWDIAVGENGDPIFIESNYRGAVWLYQLSTFQPVFGDLTKEVIKEINQAKEDTKFAKRRSVKIRKLNRKIRILKQDRKKLTKNIELLKRDLKKVKSKHKKDLILYKNELEKIKASTSWKVTKPIRKLGKVFKKV